MHNRRKRSRFHQLSGHRSAQTVVKTDRQVSPGTGNHDLYVEYWTCYRLLGDLHDVITEEKFKSDFQDSVRRLYIALAMHFRNEERLFARYGYLDGPRHSELHSTILARYLRLSDELDDAVLPAVWIKCGSRIEQMLTGYMRGEEAMIGYEIAALSCDREADLSLLGGNRYNQ